MCPIRVTRWSRFWPRLFIARAPGEGQHIELAQIESTVNMLGPSVLACAATGALPQTNGNRRAGAVPRGVFPCAGEDAWCAIEVNDDRHWQGLVDCARRAGVDA